MKLTKKICLTTTFDKLRASNACESGYKKLAITLGGVAAYGRDKDIPSRLSWILTGSMIVCGHSGP